MALRYFSVSLERIAHFCHMLQLTRSWQNPLKPSGLQYPRIIIRPTKYYSSRPSIYPSRRYLTSQSTKESASSSTREGSSSEQASPVSSSPSTLSQHSHIAAAPSDWEDNPNYDISRFSELPGTNFGVNQHIVINDEFKEALRQILWQFRAPIRYAFAYGSGVFPQSKVRNINCYVRVFGLLRAMELYLLWTILKSGPQWLCSLSKATAYGEGGHFPKMCSQGAIYLSTLAVCGHLTT